MPVRARWRHQDICCRRPPAPTTAVASGAAGSRPRCLELRQRRRSSSVGPPGRGPRSSRQGGGVGGRHSLLESHAASSVSGGVSLFFVSSCALSRWAVSRGGLAAWRFTLTGASPAWCARALFRDATTCSSRCHRGAPADKQSRTLSAATPPTIRPLAWPSRGMLHSSSLCMLFSGLCERGCSLRSSVRVRVWMRATACSRGHLAHLVAHAQRLHMTSASSL